MTDHISDLLNAAKLIADREENQMLSYLIAMALVEAQGARQSHQKKIKAA